VYINRKGNKTKTQVTESSSCCNMTHKNIPRKTWFLATGLRVGIFSHEMHYSTPPHTASSSMGGSTRSSLESPRETISGLVGRQAGGGLKHTSPPPSRPPPACPRLYRGQVGRQGGGLNLCFSTPPPPSLPSPQCPVCRPASSAIMRSYHRVHRRHHRATALSQSAVGWFCLRWYGISRQAGVCRQAG